MKDYAPPLRDMLFVLSEVAPLEEITALPGYEESTLEMAEAILKEAGRFAAGVLTPLNATGDRQGARLVDGEVKTADGWKDAYRQFVDGGWNALTGDPAHGGQGVPRVVSAMVEEMWNSANMAFALCPMLTKGSIEALELVGSAWQKEHLLPKLVSGEWTGTMLLTEPGAGSDLAAVRTKAVPQGDGTYLLEGQKIFITYGEHDLTGNIVHLVLARTPGAPEGVKGISLFVVPKFMVGPDGALGRRNDVRCTALEHKLGIHASPTAVLALGEQGGAAGWLVGEENRGLEYMFIMMNAARYAVGLEGVGLSERAYQVALGYAFERLQGTELGVKSKEKAAIVRHPDVRRMLLHMKSRTEAMRAVAAVVAAAGDKARRHPDPAERARQQAFMELMIPVVKGWSTETSVEVTSLGVQVHGGMGYVEETGAAQFFRDSRITTIYEGTTGIQAMDLIGRKIARDKGEAIGRVIADVRQVASALDAAQGASLKAMAGPLRAAAGALEEAVRFTVTTFAADLRRVAAGSVPLLDLFGTVAGGWQLARGALAAERLLQAGGGGSEAAFLRGKITAARFYADHLLTRAPGLARAVVDGGAAPLDLADDEW